MSERSSIILMVVVFLVFSVLFGSFFAYLDSHYCEFGHFSIFQNPDYCSRCGKALYNICPDCNGRNVDNASYCRHCGHKF